MSQERFWQARLQSVMTEHENNLAQLRLEVTEARTAAAVAQQSLDKHIRQDKESDTGELVSEEKRSANLQKFVRFFHKLHLYLFFAELVAYGIVNIGKQSFPVLHMITTSSLGERHRRI